MCKAFHQDGRICCSKACMYFSLFKFRFVGSHNRFPLCLREKRWWCFRIKFTFGFFFAFVMNCAHRQWFLEVLLIPCSDFNNRVIPALNAMPAEGPKITGIHYWLLASSLEISPDSQTFALRTADNEIFKVFRIVRRGTLFWNFSTICRFRNTASLRSSFYTHLLLINLIRLHFPSNQVTS